MKIDACIDDSLVKLSPQHFDNGHRNTRVCITECELFMWPQRWVDSSCGHETTDMLCCPKVTSAPCLVVVGPMGDACVYHNQKFAYKVEVPGDAFWQGIKGHNLPGAVEVLNKFACLEKKEVSV